MLDPVTRELVPEILPLSGIESDLFDLRELVVKTIENMEQDNLLNLRILVTAWNLDPTIMESEFDESGLSVLDVALKQIVRICRETSMTIRISSITLVFGLLNDLAKQKCA